MKEAFRIVGFEIPHDAFKGKIGKDAVIRHVLDVLFPLCIYGLKQCVRSAVKLGRKNAEFIAQFDVECGGRFYPPAIDIKKRVAVVQKQFFAAHEAAKFFRAKVIEHVGQSDGGGQPDSPSAGGQQVGFGKAESSADGKNMARLVVLPLETDSIGVIANAITNAVEKSNRALDIGLRSSHGLRCKFPHPLSVEVEELGGAEMLGRRLRQRFLRGGSDGGFLCFNFCGA